MNKKVNLNKDIKKYGLNRAIKRLNKREVSRYYSHLYSPKEDIDSRFIDYENMPDNYMEYPTVDKVTDDFINGRGEFSPYIET